MSLLHVKLLIKPFSANDMHYQQKKHDTRDYKIFKGTIKELIGGDYKVDEDAQLKLTLVSGVGSKAADLDNTFKPLLDSMQLCMGFDDKQIYAIEAYKNPVKRQDVHLMILLEQKPKYWFDRRINKLLEDFE